MAPGPVRVEHEGGLADVTIDAPPLNLFDDALQAALAAACLSVELPRRKETS